MVILFGNPPLLLKLNVPSSDIEGVNVYPSLLSVGVKTIEDGAIDDE